ncbi:MAG: winged helix-turn-helix domain-containing protein [Acidiferrobacterales bacterium]|nr:winged helix-turn-helix domain-containing protein [Acidiferrobacterales bacterium]
MFKIRYDLDMDTAPTISSIGTLIGDPTRAVVLANLLDGAAWTAGELAKSAGVTPQTISSHLRMLLDAGILHGDSQGRHRYFRLATPEVAAMLESLTALSSWHSSNQNRISKRPIRVPDQLRRGRTCYDHLAGQLGVSISDAMIEKGVLAYGDTEFRVTMEGADFFRELDINCDELKQQKRKFAHQCLDWSERRYHIAGALGSDILRVFEHRKWIAREKGSRAVSVTRAGAQHIRRLLGADCLNF